MYLVSLVFERFMFLGLETVERFMEGSDFDEYERLETCKDLS